MNRKSLLYKIFVILFIIQEKTKFEQNSFGKLHVTRRRYNPYNPLTYILFFFLFVIGIIMFGFIGIWKEIYNPFKWTI